MISMRLLIISIFICCSSYFLVTPFSHPLSTAASAAINSWVYFPYSSMATEDSLVCYPEPCRIYLIGIIGHPHTFVDGLLGFYTVQSTNEM
jgi:hypothetical protein